MVSVRGNTSDRSVLRESLGTGVSLAPVPDPKLVWDLGANIGLTVALIAEAYPTATVVGVEMEPANAALARRNIAPWSDRARVIEAAVWTEDGELRFSGAAGLEAGFHIDGEGSRTVKALSLDSLAAETGTPDYIKMDIEGAERDVLRNAGAWVEGVRSIKAEVHGSYTVDECMADLNRLGFSTHPEAQHWWPPSRGRPCVVGIRNT